MEHLHQSFTVKFEYNVYFTSGIFNSANTLFSNFLNTASTGAQRKILFVIDQGVIDAHPGLTAQIKQYFAATNAVQLVQDI
ncbi:MAG: 3-dehydroquinate synthase, partial [Sphingobacteriales bacterium]